MRVMAAVLVALCLAGTGYSVETWSAGVLTVTADSLGSMVDPLGQQQDFDAALYSVPAMAKDAFNALPGLKTITFNKAPDARQATTSIVAYYDSINYVTFSDFGSSDGYNYSGGYSAGRNPHSGTQPYHQLGTVGGTSLNGPFHGDAAANPALNWFKASIAVSEPGKGVSAIGFIVDARDDQNTQNGHFWITLNDGTEVQIPYATFGGAAGQGLFFGYEAPTGKFITGIEASRANKSGNSFLALDDLAFVVTPEPMTLALLAMGGLLAARRRR
jgi:hypothetical protein